MNLEDEELKKQVFFLHLRVSVSEITCVYTCIIQPYFQSEQSATFIQSLQHNNSLTQRHSSHTLSNLSGLSNLSKSSHTLPYLSNLLPLSNFGTIKIILPNSTI